MRISLILATTLFVGCGIPGTTPLADLDLDDAELICSHVDYDTEDRVVDCDGTEVTIEPSDEQDCLDYFAAVRDAANPDCVAEFDAWKACKSEDPITDGQVCGTDEYTPSADCVSIVVCATPPA